MQCGVCAPGFTSYTDMSTQMHVLKSNATSWPWEVDTGSLGFPDRVMSDRISLSWRLVRATETHWQGSDGVEWANIPPRGHRDYRKYLSCTYNEGPFWTTYSPLRVKGFTGIGRYTHGHTNLSWFHSGGTDDMSFLCTLILTIGATCHTLTLHRQSFVVTLGQCNKL